MRTQHTDAFAAGFFVGEGNIGVVRKLSKKGYVRHVLKCSITNTEIDLLLLFETHYGGRVRPRKGTALSKKPLWSWDVEGATAESFLISVQPYLRGRKLLQANYAIELRSRMRGNRLRRDLRGRAIPIDQLEVEGRDNILKLMKAV